MGRPKGQYRAPRVFDAAYFQGMVKPDQNGCWIWQGYVFNTGYGGIYTPLAPKKHTYRQAHRISYKAHKGDIPEGLCVCHTCDVKLCVNPDHLWLGTSQENIADMVQKGRQARQKGEAHGHAKLEAADVLEIRARESWGEERKLIASLYGVPPTTITQIVNRSTWSHI